MKLRSLAAAALTLALGLSLTGPALAADAADARLTKVTQAVKSTLEVGDEYEKFYGEPDETMLGARWRLSWSKEDGSLNVTATETGKVLSMNRWDSEPSREQTGFGPAFPALTHSQAREKAVAFLSRVLTAGEKAVFDQEEDEPSSLNASSYSFQGSIELNGIPSPLSFNLRVRVSDGAVTSFWRGDVSDYVGALSAADTATSAEAARALLRDTLELELIYVRDKDGEKAVLRYVPKGTDDFYVDAATGKLVNLTELRRELAQSTSGSSVTVKNEMMFAPEADADEGGLSRVELEGIAKLEGTLDQEELDKAVRSWTQLGLTGYELAGASYRVEREDDDTVIRPTAENGGEETAQESPADAKVSAYLTYVKKDGDNISRRSVTLDAKTGELTAVSGYNSYVDAPVKVSQETAQANALAFLKALWGDQAAKCELYTSSEPSTVSGAWYFTFAQKVNGYFFPANALTVRVSAADGSIMGVSRSFDDDVTFDDAENLITEDAALTAWVNTFPVELAYITVPVKLDLLGGDARPLINAGYSYYNALKPGYALGDQETWYAGVDAKTGEPVEGEDTYEPLRVTYDDLSGHWAQAALEELAEFNVGWFGGKAEADKALTQLDYIALLASADGYAVDLSQEGAADDLYDYAIRRGLLTAWDRGDYKVLTRVQAVKLLLDSLGYKQVANLKNIFRCDFADADAIPAELMGYAALAQGLGIVNGDGAGNFAAARSATRGEAAMMLWQYMKR